MNDCKHLIVCHEPQVYKWDGKEKVICIAVYCVLCGAHIRNVSPEDDES